MSNDIIRREGNDIIVAKEFVEAVTAIEGQKKRLDEQYKEYKVRLQDAMERNGITSIDTDELHITYIEPHEQLRVNSKELQKNYPDAYWASLKSSDVKASVRIKVK